METTNSLLGALVCFSCRHRAYILNILGRVIEYYGSNLAALAVFGSYARGDNRKNSDLDLLVVLKKAPPRRQRLEEFVHQVEKKHERLAQEIYEEEDIYCDVSPYILTVEEALMFQPVYFDFAEHHLIIFDGEGILERVISSVKKLMHAAGARKTPYGNRWGWETTEYGFLGGRIL